MIYKTLNYLQSIFFKYLLRPLFIFGLFILFREPLERIINNLFVETFFQYINRDYSKDLVLLLFLILVISLKLKRKLGDFRFLFPTFFSFLFIYLFYRFGCSTKWQIEPLHVSQIFTYLDSLFLILFLILIPFRSKKESSKSKTLFEDIPLHEGDNQESLDNLGYKTYAEEIAKKICENSFEKAFAIGINGKWGSGKSSFIKLIDQGLNKSDFIKINFNPWASKNPESITQDFFEELEENLIENSYLIGNLISSYSAKILNNNSNNWIKSFVSIISSVESFNRIQKRLENTIANLDKKILIVIDDIDRLDSKEIFEILKIVRNTANFKNIIYLLAYDRDYVVEKIQVTTNGLMDNYLEKIIQLEIFLPYYEKKALKDELNKKLKRAIAILLLSEDKKEKIKSLKEYDIKISEGAMFFHEDLPLIENLRDVTRLMNSILTNWKNVIGDVNVSEFFNLEILRIKEPEIYETLKSSKKKYIELNSGEFKLREGPTILGKDIENYCKKYQNQNLAEIRKTDIIKILEKLFGQSEIGFENLIDKNYKVEISIRRPSRFDVYFYYYIPNHKIPYLELLNFRENKEFQEFNKILRNKISEGLEQEILDYLESINDFNDLDDFEGILNSIKIISKNKLMVQKKINFESRNFFDKILIGYIQFTLNNINIDINKYFEIKQNRNDPNFIRFIQKYLSPKDFDESVEFEVYQLENIINTLHMYRFEPYLIEDLRKPHLRLLKG